jgi:hypothetical protein
MSVLGWFLAAGGLAGIVFALRMMMKSKKMQTVPFKTPSEIAQGGAQAADAKGMISTEGNAEAGPQPLTAPMSGQPCLAYEIKIERRWEKQIQTEKGFEKKTGTDKVLTQYQGSQFRITDGSGAVDVDASKEPDAAFEQAHTSTIKVGMVVPGTLQFGQMQVNTPVILPDAGRTSAFVGTEKILKPGNLYALGQLQNGILSTPKGALTGRLTLSSKGRSALLASTRRNMILGYAIGGVLAIGGTTLGIFGPKPTGGSGCGDFSGAVACAGKIHEADGVNLKWTVPKDGNFKLTVKQPKVKFPIDATLTVFDAAGKQIAYNDGGSPGADATVAQKFEAGVYKVNVRDFARHKMSGGYSYSLEVVAVEDAPSAPVAALEPADEVSEACQHAVDCCIAVSGKHPESCDALRKAEDATCETSMKGFRRAAKHNKAAKAVCQL